MQQLYPGLACDFVEQIFTVDNPNPKLGMAGVRPRDHSISPAADLAHDGWHATGFG